jgi:hypothetical protein
MAAGGRDCRRCDRRLSAIGGPRLRVRPGVPGIDRAVASRRRVLRRSDAAGAPGVSAGFGVHPVLLDAALHAVAVTHEGPRRQAVAWCHSRGRVCRCMRRGHRRCGRGLRRRVRRRCRWSWPTGWGCRCCRSRRWWRVRCHHQQLMAAVSPASGRGSALRAELVARDARIARRDTGLRRVRILCRRRRSGGRTAIERTHDGVGCAAILVDRARLRCAGGGDPRGVWVAGGGRHRSGRCRGVGVGAFGADRASRPDCAGGFRCAAE